MEDNRKQDNNKLLSKFYDAAHTFSGLSLLFLALIILFGVFENAFNAITRGFESGFLKVLLWSSFLNVLYWIKLLFISFAVFTGLYFLSPRFSIIVYKIFIVFSLVVQLFLLSFFNTSLVLLGADLYNYSLEDIMQTVGASGGINFLSVATFLLLVILILSALYFFSTKIRVNHFLSLALPALSAVYMLSGMSVNEIRPDLRSEFENSAIINKSDYFFRSSFAYLFPENYEIDIYDDSYIGSFEDGDANIVEYEYVDEVNYPFLHKDASRDVLSPFFQTGDSAPNIVILLVEGLGRAFSNEGAYLQSFTPFLDSLSTESLSWSNALSQGGRTFAVLPSILGSLPFAKSGFLELKNMPDQLSLLNLLKFNGYHTSFYYGGDSKFDRMKPYLEANHVDEIRDEFTFPKGYLKLPAQNNFTWGYNDKELFRYYLTANQSVTHTKPKLDILLTVSTHNPFLINESDKYNRIFDQYLKKLGIEGSKSDSYENNRVKFASMLYTDDAIRYFINEYKKRPDYGNTILR